MLIHKVIPFSDQTNPGVDRNDPTAAVTAIELQFPETFSQKAWRVIRYFEGAMYLYSYKGKFVATDESLELTEYGDGSSEAPYGAPRFVCSSLYELEKILEDLADLYDDEVGEIPGWEVEDNSLSRLKTAWQKPSENVMVKLVRSNQFIGVKTYCRKYGSHGRFLIFSGTLHQLMEQPVGTTRYEEDCGDYVKITRLTDHLHFSFAWLNTYSDGSVKGVRQDLTIPLLTIRLMLGWKESGKHLYVPPTNTATIDARPAAETIREIAKSKQLRSAFSKAMRDSFRWPGEHVTLYPDGKYSFYFTTRSGFPKNGGLILHEGIKDGHKYLFYSVHT